MALTVLSKSDIRISIRRDSEIEMSCCMIIRREG